jgi:hypothetical protein
MACDILPPLIFDGDTTISALKKKTNGKPPSKLLMAFLSLK